MNHQASSSQALAAALHPNIVAIPADPGMEHDLSARHLELRARVIKEFQL